MDLKITNFFTVLKSGEPLPRLSHDHVKESGINHNTPKKKQKHTNASRRLIEDAAEESGEETVNGDECGSDKSMNYEDDKYEKDSFIADDDEIDDLSSVSAHSTPEPKKQLFNKNRQLQSRNSLIDEAEAINESSNWSSEMDYQTSSDAEQEQHFNSKKHLCFDGKLKETRKEVNKSDEDLNFYMRINSQFSGKSENYVRDQIINLDRLSPTEIEVFEREATLKGGIPITETCNDYDVPQLPSSCIPKSIGHFNYSYRFN